VYTVIVVAAAGAAASGDRDVAISGRGDRGVIDGHAHGVPGREPATDDGDAALAAGQVGPGVDDDLRRGVDVDLVDAASIDRSVEDHRLDAGAFQAVAELEAARIQNKCGGLIRIRAAVLKDDFRDVAGQGGEHVVIADRGADFEVDTIDFEESLVACGTEGDGEGGANE